MSFQVRRVVTGYDAEGKLAVTSDSEASSFRSPAGEACGIWMMPQGTIALSRDEAESGKPVAARWYIVTVPPDHERAQRHDDFAPGLLHENNSVDLVMVLSGEIWLELEGVADWVHLRAGQSLVQRGTKHAWHNLGDQPASMSCVNFTAVRDRSTPSRLNSEDFDFHGMMPTKSQGSVGGGN
jgi:quercetin dioxygenase-like cupin family protein